MARVPTPAECLEILKALGTPARVVEHTQAVAAVARPVAERLRSAGRPVDVGLVVAGALLHDVGRARTQGLDHAMVGATLLRQRALPEALCRIVERHTGAGIDAEEARALGLPVRDYTPETLEEKIVCQADNLIDGTRRQKVQEEIAHLRGRGLDRVADKIRRLHEELSSLAGRDLDDIA